MNALLLFFLLVASVLDFTHGQGFGFDSARRRQFGPFSNNQLYPYGSGAFQQQPMVGAIAQQSSGYGFDSARRRMFGGGGMGPGTMFGTNLAGVGGPAFLGGNSPLLTETRSESRTLQRGGAGLPGFFG